MEAFENYDFNRVRASSPSSGVAFFSARIPQLRRGRITDERFEEEWSVDRNKTPPELASPNSLPFLAKRDSALKPAQAVSLELHPCYPWMVEGLDLSPCWKRGVTKQRCHFDRGVFLDEPCRRN